MMNAGAKFAMDRLRQTDIAFGKKLHLVTLMIPKVDDVTGVIMVGLLLDSALRNRPTLGELYDLCDASNSTEIIHEYLRGFFLVDERDERRKEMAERLEEVISFRMSQNKSRGGEKKLKHTIATYLMNARN